MRLVHGVGDPLPADAPILRASQATLTRLRAEADAKRKADPNLVRRAPTQAERDTIAARKIARMMRSYDHARRETDRAAIRAAAPLVRRNGTSRERRSGPR